MAQNDKIQLFEDKRIRTAWDEEKEEWYFSIVLVVVLLAAAGGQGQHHHQRQQQRGHFFRHVHGSKPAFQFVYALLDGGGERKIPGFPKNFSLFKRREMCYTILEQKSEGGTDVADRVILHCDLNCFFASVELLSYPALRNVPVAATL